MYSEVDSHDYHSPDDPNGDIDVYGGDFDRWTTEIGLYTSNAHPTSRPYWTLGATHLPPSHHHAETAHVDILVGLIFSYAGAEAGVFYNILDEGRLWPTIGA